MKIGTALLAFLAPWRFNSVAPRLRANPCFNLDKLRSAFRAQMARLRCTATSGTGPHHPFRNYDKFRDTGKRCKVRAQERVVSPLVDDDRRRSSAGASSENEFPRFVQSPSVIEHAVDQKDMPPGDRFARNQQHGYFVFGCTSVGIRAKAEKFDGEGDSLPVQIAQEIGCEDEPSHKNGNGEIGRIVEARNFLGDRRNVSPNCDFGKEGRRCLAAGQS